MGTKLGYNGDSQRDMIGVSLEMIYPLVICCIAIENGTFIVDLPNLKMVILQFVI